MPRAVVIGAGPNGLVAANVLADHGWDVTVLEANRQPGGAVRTAELTAPGFRNDVFSAFYPLAAASPVIAGLRLEADGLRWTHAPAVLAHPLPDSPAGVLSRDLDATAGSLDRCAPGDGAAYRAMIERWRPIREPFVDALLSPFPPIRAGARLLFAGSADDVRELVRLAVVPIRREAQERFDGEPARMLLAGNALHADLTPESAGSAIFGWLLTVLGQDVGVPVPVGGAGELTGALVRRLERMGGTLLCEHRVRRVDVHDGRAVGVTTADGDSLGECDAVLADCDAAQLYLSMVAREHLPAALFDRLRRYERGAATVKIDWALSSPIPWSDPSVAGAGTGPLASGLDELTMTPAQLSVGQVPANPFLLVGQMTTADPTRSPPGTESAWVYTHVPQRVRGDAGPDGIGGAWDDRDRELIVERIERRIERLAPGFGTRILARHVMTPPDLESRDANLVGGDVGGGTSQLHQQLVFRPVPGLGRAETPIRGLYLASASAHPGGGVHGACGANAARAAIAHERLRSVRRRLRRGAAR